ncbi:MAG: GatB/YqeY domain-containing protein [Candidatus Yanofskybacteria bacterium]|nr:GatB/YqeY domain-containing protein [Candidatus Yanofskybacteria bacterium]
MLKEKLQQDVKDALKSGDSKKRMVLGMALSAIKNKEIEKRSELSDDGVVAVIASEIKKRKDAVEQYQKGGRPELAEGERGEAEMLMAYMPEQMSEEDVRSEVKKIIAEIGAKDMKEMGKVIGAVMAKVKGKADGQLVSRLVKEELSK